MTALTDLASLARTLAHHARRDRAAVALIVVALFAEALFGALVPVAFGRLIDRTIPERDAAGLTWILVFLGGGAILISLAGIARDALYARVQSDLLRNLRVAMFERLQRLSLDFFGRTHSGDILARFSGDLATIDGALLGAPPWLFLPACDVLICTMVLFWLDWRLALLAMLIWPVSLLGPRYFGARATAASHERKHDEGLTLSAVHENVAAQATLRVFLFARESLRRFGALADRLAASSRRLGFASAMVERSAGVGINVMRVLVLGVGAVMAFRGDVTLGVLAGFQAVFLSLSSALSWISQYLPTVLQAAGSMERVQQLLGDGTEEPDADAGTPHARLARAIDVRSVSFAFPNGRAAIDGVSLTIPAGSSVAVVGASGSGKSTLLTLLLRLHDPASGAICLDGRDLRDGSITSLRRQMAVVSQDSFLFGATVAENIRIGRPDATDADVVRAARAAEIHDVIAGLPAGYETLVGEGGMRLSGGQRQRVALARALVRDPAILLLDEATSALDAATEAAVNATLQAMAAGRTVVSVTHRLSTVANAHRVFVMSAGKLVEQGAHAELLAREGGVYRNLWNKQHGFLAADDTTRVEVSPERLRRISLLALLDDATLADLAPMFVIEQRPAGTVLVYEGDVADKFYILVRGRVEVTRAGADGAQAVVAWLDDGDHFGEVGLLHDVPRNATVRTLTDCNCLVLDRERFRGLVARVPRLRDELVRRMSSRVSVTTPLVSVRDVRE